MSAGPRLPLAVAADLASRICNALAPHVERVEVVGGVRRGAVEVGDIDLLCIKSRTANLLGQDDGAPVDDLLARWVRDGRVVARSGCKPGWKHASFYAAARPDFPIELYACAADNWGLWSAIRTGPAGLSRQLVTPAGTKTRCGLPGLLPGHLSIPDGSGFRLRRRDDGYDPGVHGCGGNLHTPSESDVWRLYGLRRQPVVGRRSLDAAALADARLAVTA